MALRTPVGQQPQPPPASSGSRPRRGSPRGLRRRRRRVLRLVRLTAVLVLAWLVWSIGTTLLAPGGDSTPAKLAEWARDHGLGFAVSALETVQYDLSPPQVGGTTSIPTAPPAVAVGPAPTDSGPHAVVALAPNVPTRLSSPAGTPLPGEGVWHALETVMGTPALFAAYVRPDPVHTSYLAGVVSIDPRLVRFSLHPGAADPGPGSWHATTYVPVSDRPSLLATFNGGFKVADSQGGFYLNGATAGTLTPGAASIVFHRDGHVSVGVWGADQKMAPDVVAVRQNLRPIVTGGHVVSGVDQETQTTWGATIGGAAYVWRSGFGVTADGRLIFAYGPSLSVHSIADLLQRAGVVTGMQMEINPAWMSFMSYQPTKDPSAPTPVKLLSGQERPADRYFTPTSRDFIEVTSR